MRIIGYVSIGYQPRHAGFMPTRSSTGSIETISVSASIARIYRVEPSSLQDKHGNSRGLDLLRQTSLAIAMPKGCGSCGLMFTVIFLH